MFPETSYSFDGVICRDMRMDVYHLKKKVNGLQERKSVPSLPELSELLKGKYI